MSNTNTGPAATQTEPADPAEVVIPEAEPEPSQDDSEKFPRDYVEKIRRESAGYRDRAKSAEGRVDELSRALFTARVEASGKLADATDLPYSADLLDDPAALDAAVDILIGDRPHYAKRAPKGDVGQGNRGDSAARPSFASLIQQRKPCDN
jgi:hypothetical protein